MDRMQFMTRVAALGCSAAARPLVMPVALASAPWDTQLVVVILRGAMDGLDVCRPHGDPDFARLRKTWGQNSLVLIGFYVLQPALERLLLLWHAGEFGAANAVSTPYRDKRSHFDGQDILEAGKPGLTGAENDGWLNRMMQSDLGMMRQTAFASGRDQQSILTGADPAARWSPEAALDLSPQAQRLLELVYSNDPLFATTSAQAIEIAKSVEMAAEDDAVDAHMMMADPMMPGAGQMRSMSNWPSLPLHGCEMRPASQAFRSMAGIRISAKRAV